MISTTYDFNRLIPDLGPVSYVADPVQWHFYLRVPDAWRVMFPIEPDTSDGIATSAEYALATLSQLVPKGEVPLITHTTLYRVHQAGSEAFGWGVYS